MRSHKRRLVFATVLCPLLSSFVLHDRRTERGDLSVMTRLHRPPRLNLPSGHLTVDHESLPTHNETFDAPQSTDEPAHPQQGATSSLQHPEAVSSDISTASIQTSQVTQDTQRGNEEQLEQQDVADECQLPLEVLLQIFVHLDSIERRRIERVCCWWRAVIRDELQFQQYIRIDARYFILRFVEYDEPPNVWLEDNHDVFPTLDNSSMPLPYSRLPDLMRLVVTKLLTPNVKLVVFTSVSGDIHSLPYALPAQLLYSLFHDARRDLPPFVVAITGGSSVTDWLEYMSYVDPSLRCEQSIKARRCWDKSGKVSPPATECRPTEYWVKDSTYSSSHYAFDNAVRASVLRQEGLQLRDAACQEGCTCGYGHPCPWQLHLHGFVDWFYDGYNHPRRYDKGPSWINRCERWVVEWKTDTETAVPVWQVDRDREPLSVSPRLLECTKLRDSPADHQQEAHSARSS